MTEKFVHRKNIEHFRKLLAESSDPTSRAMIQKLLDEETAKDEILVGDGGRPQPDDETT